MSLRHLLWMEDSYNATAANLFLARVNSQLLTPTEEQLLAASKGFFDEAHPPHAQAHHFVTGLAPLYETHSHIMDMQALYGLAVLANVSAHNHHADEEGDTTAPMSASYAREVLRSAMDRCMQVGCRHPGVLHFLIHAYDYADTPWDKYAQTAAASLSLAAPDAPHVSSHWK